MTIETKQVTNKFSWRTIDQQLKEKYPQIIHTTIGEKYVSVYFEKLVVHVNIAGANTVEHVVQQLTTNKKYIEIASSLRDDSIVEVFIDNDRVRYRLEDFSGKKMIVTPRSRWHALVETYNTRYEINSFTGWHKKLKTLLETGEWYRLLEKPYEKVQNKDRLHHIQQKLKQEKLR